MNTFFRAALPLLLWTLWALVAVGCKGLSVPPEIQTFSKDYIALVQTNELDRAESMLVPEIRKEGAHAGLEQAHQVLDHGAIAEIKLLGSKTLSMSGREQFGQTYDVHFVDGSLVRAEIVVRREGTTPPLIATFRVTPLSKSGGPVVEKSKGPFRYVVFALGVAVLATILFALVQCLRSKVRRKWLWCLGMIFGAGQIAFDASTGAIVNVRFGWVTLFGAGVYFGPDGSLATVTLSIPVVAILFLVLRRSLATTKAQPSPRAA